MTGLICALLAAAVGALQAEPYAWPLDLPRIITSTFGEYRVGRFHAGVDLHTGGIGKPVHAPADGYIARVACSPWGYGKAVYLKLKDGHTVVFGHLSDYAPSLREYVRKAQHARHSYMVDLTPDPGAFPVKRGEVVALSGDTGIGVAHLHYEIRDTENAPINPRNVGVDWPDAGLPTIRKVLVVPRAPDSTVNGDVMPAILNVRPVRPGHYTCEPVSASGRVGFGVDTIDPANNGDSKLGVYRVRTACSDAEIFRIQMDRFTYDNRYDETVSYYPFLLDKGSFLLQWRWPGNVCDIFQRTKGDGWFEVPDHPCEVDIEAEDYDGNAAVVTIPLKPSAAAQPARPVKSGTGKGSVTLDCVGTWLVATAAFTAPESDVPSIEVEGAVPDCGVFRRVNDRTFRAAIVPQPKAQELSVRIAHVRLATFDQRIEVFHRGDAARTLRVGGAAVTVKPESPYGTLYLRASEDGTSNASAAMRGGAIRLWPAILPVDAPLTIAFSRPEGIQDLKRAAVYRDCGSYWSLESDHEGGNPLTIETRHLGAFAVLEDTLPPSIRAITVQQAPKGDVRRPFIRAAIGDGCSGIAEFGATCNGQWLLFSYDPEKGVIQWERDEDLPEGAKEVVITVTDHAGNQASMARSLEPSPPKPAARKSVPAKAKPKAKAQPKTKPKRAKE